MPSRSSLVVGILLAGLVLAGALPPAAGDEAPVALRLRCDGAEAGAVAMMEASYVESGCWAHVGMHQYFVGRDTVYALHGGAGRAFVVEQQLAPPVEEYQVDLAGPQVNSTVYVETSLDGKAWRKAAVAGYRFAGFQPGGTSQRQDVFFDFQGGGETFRFVRVRTPLSATQGLSGYLDWSDLTLQATPLAPAEPPALVPQQGALRTCLLDLMEAPWAAHPCFYGNAWHWDAPSFFHTYALGDARLDRIEGTLVLGYFRPQDPGTCCGQSIPGIASGPYLVQASVDGVAWDTVGTGSAIYGAPQLLDLDGLGGKPAAFVRIVSEKHPGYWNHPALKHPEAYVLFSELRLSGQLPASP